jgi:putative transposase
LFRCKKVKRPSNERVTLQIARKFNDFWSLNFVSDSLPNARIFKCHTVNEDFCHECINIAVYFGISGHFDGHRFYGGKLKQ